MAQVTGFMILALEQIYLEAPESIIYIGVVVRVELFEKDEQIPVE